MHLRSTLKLQTWLPGLIREKAIYERSNTSEMNEALVNETKSHDMNERQFRVWAPALVIRIMLAKILPPHI